MSAYKDALHIAVQESDRRALLASELLSSGRGVVVLDGTLALRPEPDRILCEVIATPVSLAKYRGAVEAAQALLKRSTIFKDISKPLSWLVVDDYGMGTVVLWQCS